jgi:PAS domain S-box-containing protein
MKDTVLIALRTNVSTSSIPNVDIPRLQTAVGRSKPRRVDQTAPGAAPSNRLRDEVMNTLSSLGEALLATASDAIIATDRGGAVTFWNAGAVRIFGFSAAEALGQSLDLIIPDNLRDRHWRGYDRVMATGESRYGHGDLLSVPALTKDGRRISVEFTIVMLKDEQSRPTGTAAILRDVTQRFEETRKLKRDLAEALRAG